MSESRPRTGAGIPDPEDLDLGGSSNIMDRVIEGAVGKVLDHADARTVYGDAVTQGDRTIIPVARVSHSYGFGGGSGTGPEDAGGGEGGGGGGGLRTRPVGYIEIVPDSTEFVPIIDRSAIMSTIAPFIGLALVILVWRLTRGEEVIGDRLQGIGNRE